MKRIILIIMAAVCVLLGSCAGGETEAPPEAEPQTDGGCFVNIVNRTGLSVGKLFLVVGNAETLGENRLEKPLPNGGSVRINLGELTAEELEYGYRIQVLGEGDSCLYGEELGSDYIYFDSGSSIILLTPESGEILEIVDSLT